SWRARRERKPRTCTARAWLTHAHAHRHLPRHSRSSRAYQIAGATAPQRLIRQPFPPCLDNAPRPPAPLGPPGATAPAGSVRGMPLTGQQGRLLEPRHSGIGLGLDQVVPVLHLCTRHRTCICHRPPRTVFALVPYLCLLTTAQLVPVRLGDV